MIMEFEIVDEEENKDKKVRLSFTMTNTDLPCIYCEIDGKSIPIIRLSRNGRFSLMNIYDKDRGKLVRLGFDILNNKIQINK